MVEVPQERVPAFDIAQLEGWADVVEIKRTTGCEWMEVPEVFGRRPHYRWPAWPERTRWTPLPDVPWAEFTD